MPTTNVLTINDIVYAISNLHYTKTKTFPLTVSCLNTRQAIISMTEHLSLLLNINKYNLLEIIIKDCDYIAKVDSITMTCSYLTDSGEFNIESIKSTYNRILRDWI